MYVYVHMYALTRIRTYISMYVHMFIVCTYVIHMYSNDVRTYLYAIIWVIFVLQNFQKNILYN